MLTCSYICSTETLNLQKTEGQAKLGGTLVCVFGAVFMAMFRGPGVFGYKDLDFATHGEISAKGQPEPGSWIMSVLINMGLDHWHLGVLCLIGNCMCMATYLGIQVIHTILDIRSFISESTSISWCFFTHKSNAIYYFIKHLPSEHLSTENNTSLISCDLIELKMTKLSVLLACIVVKASRTESNKSS